MSARIPTSFRVVCALLLCASLGFSPSALLAPKDAFEMFDEDNSGAVDEDEFAFILEYLGMKVSDEKQERLFNKLVKNRAACSLLHCIALHCIALH